MSQFNANAEYNTFIRGIITDASEIAFPENASLDEENFELSKNGSRTRRRGIEEETNSITNLTAVESLTPTQISTLAVTSFLWENAGGTSQYNILVQQIGNDLLFYRTTDRAVYAEVLNQGKAITIEGDETKEMSFDSLFGYLVISHDSQGFVIMSLDEDGQVVAESRTLQIRDIWGVDDSLEVDERPTTLSLEHEYNLKNQGWAGTARVFGTVMPQYESFFRGRDEFSVGVYPSNADILYAVQAPDSNGYLNMNEGLIIEKFFGNTPAPKGHFILDLFKRGDSRMSLLGESQLNSSHGTGSFNWSFAYDPFSQPVFSVTWNSTTVIPGPTETVEGELPKDLSKGWIDNVAAFAGRAWYAINEEGNSVQEGDSESPSLVGSVAFTQVIENKEDFSKCYQEGDPTVEGSSDPVATDGGFIPISGAGNIKKMVPIRDSLVLFADNGIWAVSGRDGIFSPTEFRTTKISEEGVESVKSIVPAEGVIYFWGKTGIFTIIPDQVTGELTSVNISKDRINNLYFNIPVISRKEATGAYDAIQRKVKWLYKDEEESASIEPRRYGNKELILDLVLNAFTKNRIYQNTGTPNYFITDYIKLPLYTVSLVEDDVEVNGDQVQVNTDDVIITETQFNSISEATNIRHVFLKLDGTTTASVGSAGFTNTAFKDWTTADAVAYVQTGYENLGDTQRQKQSVYLTVNTLPEILETSMTLTATTNVCVDPLLVVLDWNTIASAQDYVIYKDEQLLTTVNAPATSYQDNTTPGTYTYSVFARDSSGTLISASNEVTTIVNDFTFTQKTSGTSVTLEDAEYNNGRWIVVGHDATSLYSLDDGETWTSFTITGDTAVNFKTVTYANGLWVVIGFRPGLYDRIFTSPDGEIWTSRTPPAYNASDVLVYGSGNFVADGNTIRLVVSSDGLTWSHRSVTNAPLAFDVDENGNWLGVYNTGVGQLTSSPDSITWTPTGASLATSTAKSVRYGDGVFVIGEGFGALGVTDDLGVTVTNHQFYGGVGSFYDIEYGAGMFIGSAIVSEFLISCDGGVSWDPVPTGTSLPIQGIRYNGSYFLAVGDSGLILKSSLI